jgi:hypothetical protein
MLRSADPTGIKPTNNLPERQVRPGVLWRKSSFCTQSEAGSRFVECIITNLKQQKRNILQYLTLACDAANCGQVTASLLPSDNCNVPTQEDSLMSTKVN